VQQRKDVELALSGDETQLDRVILDGISETITHLLRNAVSHGIELPHERERAGKPSRGTIELTAEQRHGMVAIGISDDGRGVPAELLDLVREGGALADVLAAPGFSTATEVSEISGRGVGLDAVKRHVESLGGSLEILSNPGAGTSAEILLPLTLAMLHVLLVARGGQRFAIPLASVQEAVALTSGTSLAGHASIELHGGPAVATDLAELIGVTAPELGENPPGVIVVSSAHRAVVMCDELVGEQDVVIKSLGLLAGVAGYLGGTILGDGEIALVLDPAYLARAQRRGRVATERTPAARKAARILVVDDQFTVRELQRSILEAAGHDVAVARDGREALDAIDRDDGIALVATDIDMPGMDGFALLEAIRSDARHASLPVVVLTSAASEEHRSRGAEHGADAYIVKQDFDQRALLDAVRRLLGD
jgi:two-component system chemotaxis sensor kinase CheA